jgi:uncharacterized protein (TIGR01777 family)
LRDGQAVLGLPAGLRWVAQHQRTGYDPPNVFVDEVAPPLSTLLPWRHTHSFTAETENATRMTDRIETAVPAFLLRGMFAYRHRQLADDLATHARIRALQPQTLTIAVTGSRGLIGTALAALLTTGGHRVIRLVRHAPRDTGERQWHPESPARDLLDGVDAVIHLAGASIAGRFTNAHKAVLRESRIEPTRRLASLAAGSGVRCFVSASAIGYYGPDRGDDVLTEESPCGTGFLADLVADWENATAPAAEAGVRVVCVRTGIVQTPRGGTLRLFFPLFLAGLGGPLGDGGQWLSWIGIDDLCDIYLHAVADAGIEGPVNAVSPNPVRNADYARTLAQILRRPALLPVPSFGPRLLLGAQGAEELALADQRVHPARLVARGYQFRHPHAEQALRHLLGRHQYS